MKKALTAAVVAPIAIIGLVIGIIWTSFRVGLVAGEKWVDEWINAW